MPAETLPVLTVTLLVATIPVPASPSGGHIKTPELSSPLGSRSLAPSSVKYPAQSPASKISGRISLISQLNFLISSREENLSSIWAS